MSITEELKKNRPNLSVSSLKTYSSVLKNLQKNMNGNGFEWFSNNDRDIIDYLKDKTPQTKKTTLSALFVLTKMQSYRDVMMEVMKKVNDSYKEQKLNVKQSENWMSIDEIKNKYNALEEKATKMLSNKAIMNESSMMEFLLLAFLGGVSGLAPRRSLDYALMKIRNFDTKKDNYYKAGKFYFNVYKTDSTYGLQVIDIPKPLDKLIKKWNRINTNDYILYSSNGNHLSSPQITRILNKALGKTISTNLLRHIYLTNVYKDVPSLSKMEDLAVRMSHSVGTAMEYIKR
jgi:2-hydroxy-3-keto-5-methylthiopentenyl-1-phosphate phosphatase